MSDNMVPVKAFSDEEGLDKMRLEDYIQSIAEQYMAAAKSVQEKYPEWRFDNVRVVARGVLKPIKVNGVTEVYVDLDEPKNYPQSDIPVNMSLFD